ncbi:hypothetical protein [Larkinella sp. C7]|uniref:hypothetical protein n=1 Tax=Larkinella sp. C7 TaxID=2576607 RepID=UPI0011114067|nr:hypothetical protein [Larkinella sp. C7]
MQVYFSNSYRDFLINAHFIEQFAQEDIPLIADQKSPVWCVAKLERYLREINGLVSIVPRRPTDSDPFGFSPYIGQELNLARRARLPRLHFVEESVLNRHRLAFPKDAISFRESEIEADRNKHLKAIRDFRIIIETNYRPKYDSKPKQATVVFSDEKKFRRLSQDLAEFLKREDFSVFWLSGERPGYGLDDIMGLETLLSSELCIFLLGERLSTAHMALAIAHAHCIPSIRLFYDRNSTECNPKVTGAIYWQSESDMLIEFENQLKSYKIGLCLPVEMAKSSSATEVALALGTMKGWERKDNLWNLRDAKALAEHIYPNHSFARDEATRVRTAFKRTIDYGRESSLELFRLLYEGIMRHRFGYEVELQSASPGFQAIRTPTQIEIHKTATCLDIACFFAALLELLLQEPLVVILEGPGFSHSLVGYRGRDEPRWDNPDLGDIRRAISLGDALFIEATGCLEASIPVGAETAQERQNKLLTFTDAKNAAERMLSREDVKIMHIVDVRQLHESN